MLISTLWVKIVALVELNFYHKLWGVIVVIVICTLCPCENVVESTCSLIAKQGKTPERLVWKLELLKAV